MFLPAMKYACFVHVAVTYAGVLRVPIERYDPSPGLGVAARYAAEFRKHDLHSEQLLLDDHHHGTTKLMDIRWGYGINMTVGDPPQTIFALLNINWNTFFVQSSYCDTYLCSENPFPTFNRTASSTYSSTFQPAFVSYDGADLRGNLASDRATIANLDIPGLLFLDVDDVKPIGWFSFYPGYSGVLGLARDSSSSRVDVPSAWTMLLEKEWLDRNVFSLSFPKGRERFGPREPGEFVLGAYPEGFEKDDAIRLPLKDRSGFWATSAESLRFGPNITEEFEDGIAYFTTDNPFLMVSKDLFWRMFNATGQDLEKGPGFDCRKRGELPKLTLGVGEQEFVLDGYEYTGVTNASENLCVLGFHWWETGEGKNEIGLGGAFIENYLMVFDADDDSVFISE